MALPAAYDDTIIEQALRLLYDVSDTAEAVNGLLAMLGTHYGLSRAYVYESDRERQWCRNTFEWCAPGIPPQRERTGRFAAAFFEGENAAQLFDANGVFFCEDTSRLPTSQRELAKVRGVRSLLQCAFTDSGHVCGFIGFDECCEGCVWSPEQRGSLTLIGKLTGVFLLRGRHKELEAELLEKTLALDLLVQATPGGIFQYSAEEDEQFVFISENMLSLLGYTHEAFVRKFENRFSLMVYEEDRARVLEEINAQIAVTDFDYCEYRIEAANGELKWVHDVGHIVTDAQGKRWFYVVVVDITRQKEIEDALRERNEENQIVIAQSGNYIFRYDIKTRALHNDPAICRLFDLPADMADYPESILRTDRVLPESREAFRAFYAAMRSGRSTGTSNLHMRTAAGQERWYRTDYTLIRDANGKPTHAVVSASDETERIEKELAYRKLQSDLQGLSANCVLYQEVNLSKDVIERQEGPSSARLQHFLTDYDRGEATRRYADENVAKESRVNFLSFFDAKRLLALHATGCTEDTLAFLADSEQTPQWYNASVRMARDPNSDDIKAFIVINNIDQEYREHQRLEELAHRDSMTQLLNHETAEQSIRQALASARSDSACALFMIDLDNFKSVNDTLGHQTGDEALKRVAQTLSDSFRQVDIVGRFGGDEFIAFIASGATARLVRRKAAMLIDAVQFSFGQLVVTSSIGIALGMGGQKPFEQLYAEADAALYRAKDGGKGQFCLYNAADEPEELAEAEPTPAPASVQLKTLLENMDGGIIIAEVGAEVQITYVSQSYSRMMQQHAHQQVEEGSSPLTLVAPEDLPTVEDALRKAARGTVNDCAYRIAGEQNAWQLLHAAPLADTEDGPAHVIGVITDITSLKRTEERYHIAENKYRLAAELSKALVWEVDIPARTLYYSAEVAEQLGQGRTVYPNMPESLLATGVIHPDSAGDFRLMYADLYDGIEGKEYTFLRQTEGTAYTWVRASFRFLREETGRAVRAIGVLEKMPNVNVEMRTFRNELRFMDLTAPTLPGAVRLNLSQDAVEKCTLPGCAPNLASEKGASLSIGQLRIAGDDTLPGLLDREKLLALYQEGQTWLFREYERADGHWMNLAVNLLRQPISGEVFAFGYYRCVDNRRRLEQAIPANAVERDSSTLLYTRETLRAIYGAALQQADHGARCAMVVLELSGLAHLKETLGMQAVQRLLFLVGRACRIVIEGDVAIGHLDETHIAYFHWNASDQEQERAQIERYRERIRLLLRQLTPDVEMKVYYGFALAERATFDDLTHRAEIACTSSGQWPEHPVIAYADPYYGGVRELQEPAVAARPSLLVADDDPITLQVLGNILRKSYVITTAANGDQALELLRKNRYDLFISDIQMPGKTGWELLELLRQDAQLSNLPVVIVTSDTNSESEVKALSLGAADVIVKPFVARTLQSRVANIIGRWQAVQIAEENRLYEHRFQQQANLLRFAEHDELTGLYNRQAFYRRVRERLDADPHTRYMIIRWDMDNFKMLNDVLGVEAGDRLLKDLAQALRELASPSSIYARLEADHFADFLPVNQREAEAIFHQVREWFESYPLDFKLTSRIGVYVIEDPGMDVSIMCDRALLALRSIKGSFSQRIAYYSDDLRARIIEEQQLSGEMVSALRSRQFQVYFQPQYNFDSGEMIGAEALVRWNHPRRGLIPPSEFIPLFERNGFISMLDEYVWEESCRYMRKWLDEKEKLLPISVAVNISRIDIYSPHLCENLKSLVDRYHLPVSNLRLEITESAYMQNPQQLVDTVKQLHTMGFTVEMDDFGSGYSSLTTLKEVPVDILKLDMRFLSASEDEARSGNILSSVVRMAHWLKLPVLAEGVESREQAEYLKSLGCVYMQGYLFGRPMPVDEFERLLDRSKIGITDHFADMDLSTMMDFWNVSAQQALLFNSIAGGACILDYGATSVEIVRANDDFFRELGTTREAYGDRFLHALEDLAPESRALLCRTMDTAIREGGKRECVLQYQPESGEPFPLACAVRVLARSRDRYPVFVSVWNLARQVTAPKP